MSDIITDRELDKECDDLAQDIFDDIKAANMDTEEPWRFDPSDYSDDMNERALEAADGHHWTIYYHSAMLICTHCDTSNGEAFLEDVGMPKEVTIHKLACTIVYGEIRARIEGALQALCEDYEAPAWPEGAPAETDAA